MADELAGDDVAISWEEARAANLDNWNDRVPIHVVAYALDSFRADPAFISQVVTTDLPVVERLLGRGVGGLDVCHLQCHIGTDTLSFARKGARVVGVDFSAPALAAAGDLARELELEAQWVTADVLDARAAVTAQLGAEREFDLVYTSIGTVWWLSDLRQWARQVAGLLRPGGLFYIRDGHPAMYALDERQRDLVTAYRYFGNGTAQAWDGAASYIGEGVLAHTRTYEFPHPVSDVVQALIEAGLGLVLFDEGQTLPWRFSEHMVEREDGDYELPADQRDLMPLTFTAAARRPP